MGPNLQIVYDCLSLILSLFLDLPILLPASLPISYSYWSYSFKATDKELMKKGKVKCKALEIMLKK